MLKQTLLRSILAISTAAGLVANPAIGQQKVEEVEFGINNLLVAYDGECDDPRFRGPGMSSAPNPDFAFQDAADCRSASKRSKIWPSTADTGDLEFGEDSLVGSANDGYVGSANDGYCDDPSFEGPGMAERLNPDNVAKDASDCKRAYLLERTIWLTFTSKRFGNDSGFFARDDECDDPRFEDNPNKEAGMADSPDRDGLGRDRSDCESLLNEERVQWIKININKFGNNSGLYSYDGECDDPRFENNPNSEETGMADSLLRNDATKDAFDCARAHAKERIRWVEVSKDDNFGDDSGDFSYDGECDDPRFENNPDSEETGMADSLSWGDVAKDAFDCARAHAEERISLRANWKDLHDAVIFQKADLVEKILDNGTPVDLETEGGMFPLGLAAWTNEETKVINLLIRKGADRTRSDEQGLTPLIIAAMNDRSKEILQALLTDDSEQIATDSGLTPLHILAAYTEKPDKLDLFSKRDEILHARMKDGRTALHLAAEHNENPNVVSKLLDIGLDVDAEDEDGETPLYRAVFSENAQAVEVLIGNKANRNIASKKDQESPLQLAIFRKNQIICQLLSDKTDSRCQF